MALHTLTNEGQMGWTCPHCGSEQSAHHSDPGMQHTSGNVVALPACDCGAQTFIKVVFTDEEMAAPNMLEAGQPSESHATALRHMAVALALANRPALAAMPVARKRNELTGEYLT